MKVCVMCLDEHMGRLCIQGKEERSRSRSPIASPKTKKLTPDHFSVDRLIAGTFSKLRVQATADRARVTRWKDQVILPQLELTDSVIPGAGRGVFTRDFIPAKSLVTMYGGKVLSYGEAMALPENERGWIKQVAYHQESIDGRVKDEYTVDFYLQHHYLGSFVNEDTRSGDDTESIAAAANCTYVRFESPKSDLQIYGPDNELQPTTALLMIVATQDIEPGEELFSYYGADYPQRTQY